MTKSAYDDREPGNGEEAPLDPAVLRVQTRLRRLVAGSTLIMIAGVCALLAAIIYKVNSVGNVPDGNWPDVVALEIAGEVRSLSVSDGVLYLLVQDGTTTVLQRLDTATGKVLGRTTLTRP
ncbi:MAG: hypothetical protein ACK4K8_02840 [Pannonibacter sp.]